MEASYAELPINIFLNIIEFLDFKDILSCSQVCNNWYKYSLFESIWKKFCLKYWATDCCPVELTWRELFLMKLKEFSKYREVYAHVSKAWTQIDNYLNSHYTHIRESLYGGWQEKDLLNFESMHNLEIPLDLRCAYRFHGGQNYDPDMDNGPNTLSEWPNPGLFGSVQNYDYFRTNIFLPPTAHPDLPSDVMILTDCTYTQMQQYIAVRDYKNLKRGQIFSLPNFQILNKDTRHFFIIANSFLDYFFDYAAKLSAGYFPSERGHIYRFYKEPSSEAISHHVKVEVATAFIPEMSSIAPTEKYTHAYRVLMSMDRDKDEVHRCRLATRHWKIIDGEGGHEECVDGPGVIGLYPTMEPGAKFSYISCTNFRSKTGKMHGTFQCVKIDGKKIHITVPEFRMSALPFIIGNEG